MINNYKKYLQFLAAEYNILYLGNESIDAYNNVASYFMTAAKRALNQNELEHIALTLFKHKINLVIIDAKDNNEISIDFYKAIYSYNQDISILLIFDPKEYKKLFDIVPFVDITVSYPVEEHLFYKRLFTVLSTSYALKSIGRRDIVLNHKNVKEDALDKFFDTYEGSSLFISVDLNEMVIALNSGDLSPKLFESIAEKIDEVGDIFSKTDHTASITPIYKELSYFIRELDLTKIKPENLKGFNYLSQILNDVSVYLLDMFVDRIFKDVYVFEHSLKSNISFLKNTLLDIEEVESELEFF